MLEGITAIEFVQRVQDASVRFSVPARFAEALGIGDNARVLMRIEGSNGLWQSEEPVRLKSGIEYYGPELSQVANPGEMISVRLARVGEESSNR